MTEKDRTQTQAAFLKFHPHLTAFLPYLDTLNKESPRGKVLISSGFLEQQLKEILLTFLVDDTKVPELVEGGNAPLGTLAARISACYAMGLITEDERHDLNLIRGIRNDFAHSFHTTFETETVRSRCQQLRKKAPAYTDDQGVQVGTTAEGQFTSAAVALILAYTVRPMYVIKERREVRGWPF